MAFRLSGADNVYSVDHAAFLRCINHTLSRVFPHVVVLPGNTVHFFASRSGGVLTNDPDELLDRLQVRGVTTQYIRDYYLPFRLAPDRMADLETTIAPLPGTPVNSDFAPVAYYFNNVLWSTRFHDGYRGMFRWLNRLEFVPVLTALMAVLVLFHVVALVRHRKNRMFHVAAGSCAVATGFTMIGLQVMVLLAFQVVHGYVYQQLAVLVAAFMAGLALGSWFGRSRMQSTVTGRIRRMLLVLQLVAAALPPVCVVLFVFAARVTDSAAAAVVANLLFPAIALVSGGIGGCQFQVASRLYHTDGSASEGNPGMVYALDVIGASAGALIISAYLVPVYGIIKAAVLIAAVNLPPAAAVVAGIVISGRRVLQTRQR